MTNVSIKCTQCQAEMGDLDRRVASVSMIVNGDEEMRSFFLCKECDVYSVWVCIENYFTDEEKLLVCGPVPRSKGDAIVDQIRQCPDPQEAYCDCPAHKILSSTRF